MTDEFSIQQMLTHHNIERLHDSYADLVNRRAFNEMDSIFTPESVMHMRIADQEPFDVTGPEAIAQFHATAMNRFEFYIFSALAVRITVPEDPESNKATGRVWMCEVRRDVGTQEWSTAYGLFQDSYVRRQKGWFFERREYSTLTRTGGGIQPFPEFKI